MSDPCDHEWKESYYGHDCTKCGMFYPHGGAPWDDYDNDRYYPDDDWPDDEDDEDFFDCGWVRGVGCTLAGAEECDFECPFRDANYRGLALTRARLAKRAKEK